MTVDDSFIIGQSGNTTRLKKGFRFETEVYRAIELNVGYDYFQHNPTDYNKWLHNVGEGCDAKVVVNGLTFNIECKYLDTNRVYPSYVWRDYIPRFKAKSGYCVIVTNNKWNIAYNCRTILQEHNIMIWNRHEITYNIVTLTNTYLNNRRKNRKKIELGNNTTKLGSNRATERVNLNQRYQTKNTKNNELSEDSIDQSNKNRTEDEKIFESLFTKGIPFIHTIPSEKNRLISRVRRRLASLLYDCILPDTLIFKVKTMKSRFGLRKYLDIYTKNIFNCIPTLCKLMETKSIPFSDLPNVLYHGTTTMFLPEIVREGLVPSKAGKCWDDSKERRVYLTDSLYAAEAFALKATNKFGGKPVILLVDVKDKKDKLKLCYERSDGDPPTVFDIYKQFFLEKAISPKEIKDYYILPKDHSLFVLIGKIRDYYLQKLSNSD